MISIIIPAYNEAERIQAVIQETLPFGHEVIVVDDGSQDNTFDLAKSAGATVVRQENSGYIAAIKRGFQEAKGDILVTMDADGEHHPLDIQRLVWPIEHGQADMVLGKRYHVARISERLISTLTSWKTGVYDTGTGMRAIRRDLALQLTMPGRCICGTSVLEANHLGARILEIPIILRKVNKPRKIAWGHALQFFYVLRWMF
jgi:glycosyltransferase involved in cell wall biosynthesis